MLLNKDISNLDLPELLKYLDELHGLIMEERTIALTFMEELRQAAARMIVDSGGDVDSVIHILNNSQGLSSQAKLAGDASARLVKIAEIKSKVLIAMMKNEAETANQVLTEEQKQELLDEAARATKETNAEGERAAL